MEVFMKTKFSENREYLEIHDPVTAVNFLGEEIAFRIYGENQYEFLWVFEVLTGVGKEVFWTGSGLDSREVEYPFYVKPRQIFDRAKGALSSYKPEDEDVKSFLRWCMKW
jgi:hypothetical protein